MWEIVVAGGWVMGPIILCSVVALAIVAERSWTLQRSRVAPPHLVAKIYQLKQNNKLDEQAILGLRDSSPLGRVLAAGLMNMKQSREVMKEAIEECGSAVVHDLERYLNPLGTIASIAPLLGLLGTVLGMIEIFNVISAQGIGNAGALAGGISKALITTAAGLMVAIPTLISHRYFRRRVDDLVVSMEQEAVKLVEVLHHERAGTGKRAAS